MQRVCAVLKSEDDRTADSITIDGIEPDYVVRFHSSDGYDILYNRRGTSGFVATAHIDDPSDPQFLELLKSDFNERDLMVVLVE